LSEREHLEATIWSELKYKNRGFINVVLVKDGEDQVDRSCEKCSRPIT